MASDDRASEYTGVLGFFIAICTILVSLRCYTKLFIVKSFAADDYFSVLTLLSFLLFCTWALLGVQQGTGKQRYLIPDENVPEGMKWWWICEPTYIICSIFLKMSIGIFLLRIAVNRVHRIVLWSCLITIQVYSVFFLCLFTFQCTPISHFWEQFRGGKGKCIDSNILVGTFYGYSALTCVTDWIFSIVPIFIVRKLQMSKQKKISVAIVLAFCAIGSTATVVRLPYIKGLKDIPNFLYATTDVAIWSTSEVGIGLGASAAATLRPLLRKVFGDTSIIAGGSSSRKLSRTWGGRSGIPGVGSNHLSRSGYVEHDGSENDIIDHEERIVVGNGGIPLEKQDPRKLVHVHPVMTGSRDGVSRSWSTTGLRDWEGKGKGFLEEDEEERLSPVSLAQHGGIRKTVQITQS